LNIGGDIRAWGDTSWRVGVADPSDVAENAPTVAEFELRDAAVATSGSSARYINIAGKRFSHLIDPRTLYPIADTSRSSTVIAGDCVTANALSTAGCVLDASSAVSLAREYGMGHFFMGSHVFDRTAAFTPARHLSFSPIHTTAANLADDGWPKGFAVSIQVALKTPTGSGRGIKRPYVAVWIEDSNDKVVRNLSTWGKQDRYLPELSAWWKANGGNERLLRSVTSSTRAPGKYTLIWDGKDDHGNRVPRGEYRIYVEINREHGRHAREWAALTCEDRPDSATLHATAESDESKLEYALSSHH
jgi:thiamine biosynthesis lipoprotein